MNQVQQDEELLVSGQDIHEPCPEGIHPALVVDVLAGENDVYDGKEVQQIWLVWQVWPADEQGNTLHQSDGRTFHADRKFGRSITPKSKLCEFLEVFRGKKFTPEERAGFNLSKLKGIPCFIKIEHAWKGEKCYANVVEATLFTDADGKPIADKAKWPKAEKYVRGDYSKRTNKFKSSDYNGAQPATSSASNAAPASPTDDWMPF